MTEQSHIQSPSKHSVTFSLEDGNHHEDDDISPADADANNNNNINNSKADATTLHGLDHKKNLAQSTHNQGTSFTDYIPPPRKSPPPPAKYKLWLVVLTVVFFAVWFATKANVVTSMSPNGYLSPNASQFLLYWIVVFCLTYSTLDLMVFFLTVRLPPRCVMLVGGRDGSGKSGTRVRGRAIGLGPWLKQPRVKWARKPKHHNCIVEVLAMAIVTLEDGFSMFNPPHVQQQQQQQHQHQKGKGKGALGRDLVEKPKQYQCDNKRCDVVLKIEHRVDPEHWEEYCQWQKKVISVVKKTEGFKGAEFLRSRDGDEEQGGAGGGDGNGNGNIIIMETANEEKNEEIELKEKEEEEEEQPFNIAYITFSSIHLLNEWMTSKKRKYLMDELEPFLLQPDVVQIGRDRALPDAFTDLLTRQGDAVPIMLPKKWKVWWMTTLGLYFSSLWTKDVLPYYFTIWNLNTKYYLLQIFIRSIFNTFLNSYVMTPLLLFLFSDWMKRYENEYFDHEPWRTLDDGIRWILVKILVTVAFFGGCLITWAVRGG